MFNFSFVVRPRRINIQFSLLSSGEIFCDPSTPLIRCFCYPSVCIPPRAPCPGGEVVLLKPCLISSIRGSIIICDMCNIMVSWLQWFPVTRLKISKRRERFYSRLLNHFCSLLNKCDISVITCYPSQK